MVKILWVDDEIELLKPHIMLLQSKGYEVDTCNNGYDAIDMASEVAYDVIILDEMMPGMTGLETLPLIKDVRPNTPVIMVTKSEEEDIMDKAIGSKIADYIIKPVNPSQILLLVKKHIHSHQLVAEQTTADYRAEFGRIAQMVDSAQTFNQWLGIYRKLINWEIELSHSSDNSIKEVLQYQKNEANSAFCRFVRRNYQEWINSGRKVKRGAIGIAVVDQTNPEKMRFLFDQNDTVGGKTAGTAWRFPRQNESDMIKDLEKSFRNFKQR